MNLLTPCCNAVIIIEREWVGMSYMETYDPVSYACSGGYCDNEWDMRGLQTYPDTPGITQVVDRDAVNQ